MEYFKKLGKLLAEMEARDKHGKVMPLEKAVRLALGMVKGARKSGNKVIFIGNGGSAAIASHISIDLLKNARIPAIAFNDSSLLTCLSNDLGYRFVFAKPIEMLAKKGDVLFAISSSGKSENILEAARAAKKKGCSVVTLSGFGKDNPLRKQGELNFYLPSGSYGFVEIAHLALCHCIVDKITQK